uniref:ShKT domain-containing protein n=1 Tax=Marmota marmota marmota TaxID=9994 RepID=A0A8C6AGN1_MARMA
MLNCNSVTLIFNVVTLLTSCFFLKANVSFFSLLTHHPSVQMEITNKHNDLRRMTNPRASNMLKMNWNAEVAKNAEKWANRCTLSHSSRIANCGEKLFMSSAPLPWSHIIQVFYDEVKNFKYGVGDIRANSKTGHYTQLVWATSHQIGCALAHCPHKHLSYFYVCHYCPEGNNRNTKKTPYKKGKPCGDCPNNCDNGLCTNPCKYIDRFFNCADLVKEFGCDINITKENCKATCRCSSEIK